MTTGERLIKLRKKKGITQDKLADMLGVTRQAISKWELNETLPDMENAVKIADIFGVSLEFLLSPDKTIKKENTPTFTDKYDSLDFLACMGSAVLSGIVMIYWICRLMITVGYFIKIKYFTDWAREYIGRPQFIDLFNNTIDEIAVILVLLIVIKISLKIANKLNKNHK